MNDKKLEVTFELLYKKVSTYITNKEELDVIKKAYEYADEMHLGVKRLTGEKYVEHPLNVAYILTYIKADYVTIAAALMHDILEDCDVTKEEMAKEFTLEIANLVDGVTKINKLQLGGSNEVTIANHRKILVGLSEDVRVIIIKLADRLHNMRTLWVHPPKKQKEKAKETLDILTPIAHRLGIGGMKSELEDLSLRYYKPDVYFGIVEMLNKSKAERDNYITEMTNKISEMLNKNNIKHEIKGRSKSIYSIYKKLDKGKKFSDIFDLLAIRILVNTDTECYAAVGIIHSVFKPIPRRFKDYIAMPKTNMYQSLHTTVFADHENLFEIQIRTYKMDEIAETGIASHWSYKENGSVKANMQNEMEQKLQFFKSIIELQTEETKDEDFVNSVKNEVLKNTIYIFTPMGDVIELPNGSTPIDFAYRVHSKVGDKMVGAIINGSIVPLDYELKNNDIIKINTNNNSVGPSREWINIAKTQSAKNKIKAFFNKIEKEEYLKEGTELLSKELKRKKISINEFLNKENLEKLLVETKCETLNDIYIGLGNNKLNSSGLINIIYGQNETKAEIILKKTKNKEVAKSEVHNDILVDGIDDIKVNIASCCKPVPGDGIVGYITKGYGISVHRSSCPNVSSLDERLIDINWNEETEKKYSTTIIVRAENETNLLLDIISKTSGSENTVQSIMNIAKGKSYAYEITVSVKNKENLQKFINDIDSMPNIIGVERVIK
jgi:(p)ppGpp synthetase, RelA/SpoT family